MSGATLQEVADKLGYRSRQAAWKATTSLLERQEAAASDEWRAFHLSRLERLLLGQWHPAISGDSEASLGCLRILQQIGKVTGVAAPRARPKPVAGRDPTRLSAERLQQDEWQRRYAAARNALSFDEPEGVTDEE